MNTFLPYPSLKKSAQCLDDKRLGKQRVEAYQILRIVLGENPISGWRHHPITKMWMGYPSALKLYINYCIKEWKKRGFKNTMKTYKVPKIIEYPKWFGDERVHSSHRSNLLRKDKIYYNKFGWTEPDNLPYFWNKQEKHK